MDDPTGPPGAGPAGALGRGFLADLARWAADARADAAAAERTAERWHRQRAEEEATFSGVLVDLAEAGTPVVVRTATGASHRGVVAAVGWDFLALRPAGAPLVLVALGAVAAVVVAPGTGPAAAGDRPAPLGVDLATVVGELAAERPEVRLVAAGGAAAAGELRAAGLDVATVRQPGDPPTTVHVRLASLAEVYLLGSG